MTDTTTSDGGSSRDIPWRCTAPSAPDALRRWRAKAGSAPAQAERSPDSVGSSAAQHATTDVTTLSPTTILTAVVALGATAASVEGLAELVHATGTLNEPMAWAIGAVIDLAVVVLALQAREAVMSGRGGHLEMALTWVASIASGAASASWQFGRAGVQAAAVRLVLPLLAACLWHLSIVGQRAATDDRPARRQARVSRLILNLALAQSDPGDTARARRRQRHARRALLRHMASASLAAQDQDLVWWRGLIASVTIDDAPALDAFDAVPASADALPSGSADGREPARPREAPPLRPAEQPHQRSNRQLIADILRDSPDATNAQIRAALGGICSIRTIQRHRAVIRKQDTAHTSRN